MSPKKRKDVSEIVEKYRNKYATAERKLLRRLILKENPQINSRTLDRHLRKSFAESRQERKSSTGVEESVSKELSEEERGIIEKLKDGPAYPQEEMEKGILDRGTLLKIKDLERKGIIYQRDGKYFLPGYENGPPEKGREITIKGFQNLVMYQSWGWKFHRKVDNKIIVRYEKGLVARYV